MSFKKNSLFLAKKSGQNWLIKMTLKIFAFNILSVENCCEQSRMCASPVLVVGNADPLKRNGSAVGLIRKTT
jgi:hypothetical protein